VDRPLAADGASYCPSFALLDDASDQQLAAALGRAVTDGCPETRPGDTDPQWWLVTAMVGVATDEDGRPAHGADADVVPLGQGQGVLLVTDQSAACALTAGNLADGAAALVFAFDLDEVAAVHADATLVRKKVRSMTVELSGASWGAVGFAAGGELLRHTGLREAPVGRADSNALAARLGGVARR
jgi:hypothetical protein